MYWLKYIFIPCYLIFNAFLSIAWAQETDQWYLMARHGECTEIRSLQSKFSGIGKITNPRDFIKLMEKQGYQVRHSQLPNLAGKAINIEVPEKSLSLLFVTGLICNNMANQ